MMDQLNALRREILMMQWEQVSSNQQRRLREAWKNLKPHADMPTWVLAALAEKHWRKARELLLQPQLSDYTFFASKLYTAAKEGKTGAQKHLYNLLHAIHAMPPTDKAQLPSWLQNMAQYTDTDTEAKEDDANGVVWTLHTELTRKAQSGALSIDELAAVQGALPLLAHAHAVLMAAGRAERALAGATTKTDITSILQELASIPAPPTQALTPGTDTVIADQLTRLEKIMQSVLNLNRAAAKVMIVEKATTATTTAQAPAATTTAQAPAAITTAQAPAATTTTQAPAPAATTTAQAPAPAATTTTQAPAESKPIVLAPAPATSMSTLLAPAPAASMPTSDLASPKTDIQKYLKMLKVGTPRGAVEATMKKEGFDPGLLPT